MKIKVYKLSENKVDYRTPLTDIDEMPKDPKVGQSLVLTSSTHESGGIFTSAVTKIETIDGGFTVHTRNSIYQIIKQDSIH